MNLLSIEPPAELPEGAKAIWRDKIPSLMEHAGLGVIPELDSEALKAYVVACYNFNRATAALEAFGTYSYASRLGIQTPYPEVRVQKDAMASLQSWGQRLGLDPHARYARNFYVPTKESDEYDAL